MTRKTDKDIRLEDEALEMNRRLVGTGMHVVGGGRKGPFTLSIDRLSREELEKAIGALKAVLGRESRQ